MTFVEGLIFYQLPTNFLSLIPFGIKDYQRGETLCKSEIWTFSLCGTPLPPPLKPTTPHKTLNPSLCVIEQEAKEMKGGGL